jgi:hypothetical protein
MQTSSYCSGTKHTDLANDISAIAIVQHFAEASNKHQVSASTCETSVPHAPITLVLVDSRTRPPKFPVSAIIIRQDPTVRDEMYKSTRAWRKRLLEPLRSSRFTSFTACHASCATSAPVPPYLAVGSSTFGTWSLSLLFQSGLSGTCRC